ncbi:MAG: FAD-dependent monooxygenase [Pseudomonadota bacterium]
MITTPVLVAGGGPVGLITALELNYQGVDAVLIERNPTTTRHPKMDITNGRSMEIFRRLGVIDDLRAVAVHEHNPMPVLWCTDMAGHLLARFDYPSLKEARKILAETNDGTMAKEPGMRVSQVLLEPVLKRVLEERCPHITVMYGWGLESVEQDEDGVTATIVSQTGETQQVRSQYLAGCDGASSVARKSLDIPVNFITPKDYLESGDRNNYLDQARGHPPKDRERPPPRFMIHWKSPELELFERWGVAWHLQSPDGWSIISQNDKDTWTVHIPPELYPDIENADPKEVLFSILGCEFECEILVANIWHPRLGLADGYGSGRVWMAGDSTHQVIPTGGYGMNTGVGDALGLGWALAAMVQGWGGPKLLSAYENERRHVGARNRWASARHSALRYKIREACPDNLHGNDAAADAAREELGTYISELGNLENEAWGIEWGYRYEDSPVIAHEAGPAPAYEWEYYEPSSWPGGRPPNLFLDNGEPLFDLLDRGYSLLNFSDQDASAFAEVAEAVGMPLTVREISHDQAAQLYQKNLVLLRPDHHVAWRGDAMPDKEAVAEILDLVRGA